MASAFRTANLAYSLGLMKLKDDALEHILNYVLNSSNPAQDLNELLDDAQPSGVSFANYFRLATAISPALRDCAKDLESARHYIRIGKYKPQAADYHRSLLEQARKA